MTKQKDPNAVALGRRGGLSTSPKAQKAARINGRKGGRPCKCRLCGALIKGEEPVRATVPGTEHKGPMHKMCLSEIIKTTLGGYSCRGIRRQPHRPPTP